jgi:hypothetical protein
MGWFSPACQVRVQRLATFGTTKADVAPRNLQLHRVDELVQSIGEVNANQTLFIVGHDAGFYTVDSDSR